MKMAILSALLLVQAQGKFEEDIQKLSDDLAKADTGAGKVRVGDEFVKLLKKYPKKRQELLDAASDAYAKGWPDLDAIWKIKLREQLAKLYAPAVPGKAGGFPEGWGGPVDGTHKASVTTERVHSGGAAAKLVPGAKARNARLLFTPEVKGTGQKVEYSIWILSDGTDSADDEVRFYIDGSVTSKKIPKDLPVWTKITHEVETIGGSFENGHIEVVVFSRKGTVYADDLSIKVDGKEQLKNGGFEAK
jgi:hypothetical protein